MRVALVSPPSPAGRYINRDLYAGMGICDDFGLGASASFVAFLKAEGTVLPEIALPTLAALLEGHELRVFDGARVAMGAPGQAFAGAVADFGPDLIVASTSFAALAAEADFLGELKARTGARVLAYGYAAHWFARDVLAASGVDVVVSGEPEAVVPALVAGADPGSVPGTWSRAPEGVRHTGYRLVDDLDALPIPRWDAMPLGRYRYFPLLRRLPFATLLSSRGCTFGCGYCPYAAAQGTRYRALSAARVAEEVRALVRTYGVRSLLFRDPSFGLDRGRVLAIAEAIARLDVDLDWGCETRLDGLDDEVIRALARAGCRSVEIGMDSVSAAAMRANRRVSLAPDPTRERLLALRRAGIESAGLYVVGLPGDDLASIQRTFEQALELPLAWLNVEIPVPFPGTDLYADALARGQAVLSYQDLRGAQPPLALPAGVEAARLEAERDQVIRRFYLHPRRVAATLGGRAPLRMGRFLAASALRFAASPRSSPDGGEGRS